MFYSAHVSVVWTWSSTWELVNWWRQCVPLPNAHSFWLRFTGVTVSSRSHTTPSDFWSLHECFYDILTILSFTCIWWWYILLQLYCIYMDIGNSKYYLGIRAWIYPSEECWCMSAMLSLDRPAVHISNIYDVHLQPHGSPYVFLVHFDATHFISTKYLCFLSCIQSSPVINKGFMSIQNLHFCSVLGACSCTEMVFSTNLSQHCVNRRQKLNICVTESLYFRKYSTQFLV